MLSRMQTIEVNDLVSASFEACTAFGAGGDGSPVCSACGWLEAEHEPAVAEPAVAEPDVAQVHALPRRKAARPAPKRLAS
jgi:hypothetical protein